MTDAEIQSKLAECQDMIRLLTAKLTEVAAERDRLRAEKSDALSVCQEMYNNPDVPPALRLKAAGLALPHETPRLESVPPPLDLVAFVARSAAALAQASLVAKPCYEGGAWRASHSYRCSCPRWFRQAPGDRAR